MQARLLAILSLLLALLSVRLGFRVYAPLSQCEPLRVLAEPHAPHCIDRDIEATGQAEATCVGSLPVHAGAVGPQHSRLHPRCFQDEIASLALELQRRREVSESRVVAQRA